MPKCKAVDVFSLRNSASLSNRVHYAICFFGRRCGIMVRNAGSGQNIAQRIGGVCNKRRHEVCVHTGMSYPEKHTRSFAYGIAVHFFDERAPRHLQSQRRLRLVAVMGFE